MTPISARGLPVRSEWLARELATPRKRFEPERLWATRDPCACRMSASMRDMVVLPLVPATMTVPCGIRLAILSRSRGSMRSATRPGAAVPPPRPSPRIATPVALAAASAAISRASRGGELSTFGENNGDHLEPLEDDERDHRHHLRVPLGRVRWRITDAADDQAARDTGRPQGWTISRHHELARFRVAVAIEVAQL